MLNLPKTGHM